MQGWGGFRIEIVVSLEWRDMMKTMKIMSKGIQVLPKHMNLVHKLKDCSSSINLNSILRNRPFHSSPIFLFLSSSKLQFPHFPSPLIITLSKVMNDQDSSFYLFFRPLLKYAYHLLTGQTEIERVSRAHNIPALEKSIALSKVLVNYCTAHCQWTDPFLEDYANELCALKQISTADAKFRVTVALNELHSWKFAVNQLEKLRTTKYNSGEQEHERMLMEVWECLRPGRAIKSRKSQEWIQIGFQGDDPATDFRGAGYLGLINLHGWVATPEGKEAFKGADSTGTDYFFASASLFLTMLALQLVKNMQISPSYWVLTPPQTISTKFQKLFHQIFIQFAKFWSGVSDKSMMQFNINLLEFSKQMKSGSISNIKAEIESQQ